MPAHLLSAGNVICMEAEGNAAACDARLRDAYRTAFGVDPEILECAASEGARAGTIGHPAAVG